GRSSTSPLRKKFSIRTFRLPQQPNHPVQRCGERAFRPEFPIRQTPFEKFLTGRGDIHMQDA
ncbi:hypothetical protein QE361_003691, partial [Sphingomonas sp. SORGH_AS802]|uniref:hypothetical protein n=1 Tax=Sphingomonas sp. SORGH_AS_0802 TaxID=3041800 RepID=UPI0028603409